MNDGHDNRRGTRHLRVGVSIQPRSVRVVSMWVVDQPVIQRTRLTKPILVRVDLAGEPVLVEAFDDPRVSRSTFREGAGHFYTVEDTGVVYISVPFTDVRQLSDVRIRMTDASKTRLASTEADDLVYAIDDPPRSMRTLGEILSPTLQTHNDWPKVARQLGMPSEPGRFEIYVDRAGKYRWRLRRPDGEIVASSGQGYRTRDACEADLLWIRTHITTTPVVSLDLG
jgi:uncharacterized protein YegP (UPF0339 family)